MATGASGDSPRGGPLHAAAWSAAVVGALGSVGLMYNAGSRAPWLLLAMFLVWVVSPFVALAWALHAAPRWPAAARSAVHWTTLLVAAASLALYARLIPAPRSPNAFVFIVGPIVAWVVIAGVGLVVRRARLGAGQHGA
jgi:hypothetical protein